MPLSPHLTSAPAFPLPTREALGRKISLPRLMAVTALSLIMAVAVADAALRGPWLDEIWTLELSDTRTGLTALIRDGWLHDTHPPAFNAWATLLASLGIDSIPAGRLASNLLAAGLMILAARR